MLLSRLMRFGMPVAVSMLAACDRGDRAAEDFAGKEPVKPESSLVADVDAPSPHFSRVLERLDVGGKMLHFEDHEGNREVLVDICKALLDAAPEDVRKHNVDVAALVDALGLARASASGSSMRKDGDAWLMRRFSLLERGNDRGLGALLGKEPVDFRGPGLMPGGVDFLLETRIDATSLPALLQVIGGSVGQAATVDGMLAMELPEGGSVRDVLGKTNLHLTLGIDVSSWTPELSEPRPVDFVLQLEGAGHLLPMLLPQVEQVLGKPQDFGNRRGWVLPLQEVVMQPETLLLVGEDDVVTFASSRAYLAMADSDSGKLVDDPAFKQTTDQFPEKGNVLVYVSPQVPPLLAAMARTFAKSGSVDAEVLPLVEKAAGLLQERPWALCVSHEADGVSTTAEMPFAMTSDLASTLPVLSATSTLFVGARAWKNGSDRAACILNIRNVQQAVRSYQHMNDMKEGDPIPWDKIFGEDGFLDAKPTCPAGGAYKFSDTFPPVGGLSCECSESDHRPASHDGW